MPASTFAAGKAANDNSAPARSISRGFGFASYRDHGFARPRPLHIGFRMLRIATFSAVVLLAVSGAFLIGLTFVGLFAAALAAFDLIRRHVGRSATTTPCPIARRQLVD
jgi:hypothetical protein